jgi:hypothetical protein
VINVKTRQATGAALSAMRAQQTPGMPVAQWDHPHPPVLFWRAFVAAGGLDLDPKIWNIERGAVAGVAKAVESALIAGKGAGKACAAFMWETPERHDWLRVDDAFEVAPCYSLDEALTDLFTNAINRSLLAIQVLQGLADAKELADLDKRRR